MKLLKCKIKISIKKHKFFKKNSKDYNEIHSIKNLSPGYSFGLNTFLIIMDKYYKLNSNVKSKNHFKIIFHRAVQVSKIFDLVIFEKKTFAELQLRKDNLLFVTIILSEQYNEKLNLKNNSYNLIKEKKEIKNSDIEKIYPNLNNIFNNKFFEHLFLISRFLGTKYPGNESLIYSIDLSLINNLTIEKLLLEKKKYFLRFNLSEINFVSNYFLAKIKSLHKPKMPKQFNLIELKKRVRKFPKLGVSQNALILGGSSGIGSMISKILTLKKRKVVSTFYKSSLKLIKSEYNTSKNKPKFIKFNILKDKIEKLKIFNKINVIYFFATPKINQIAHNKTTFKLFFKYFITSSLKVLKFIKSKNKRVIFFYPSTKFIENQNELRNYIEIKKLGEKKIKKYCQKNNLKLCIIRLAPTDTRQNISYLPSKKTNLLTTSIKIIEEIDKIV